MRPADILPGPSPHLELAPQRTTTCVTTAPGDDRVSQPSLTRHDVAGPARPRADAARRQGSTPSRSVDEPQPVAAALAGPCSARSPRASPRPGSAPGCSLPASAAGTAAPARSTTPAGRSQEVRRELGDLPVVPARPLDGRPHRRPRRRRPARGRRGRPGPVVARRRARRRRSRGKHLVGAHGRRDRITSYRQSARFVERAARGGLGRAAGHGAARPLHAAPRSRLERPRAGSAVLAML